MTYAQECTRSWDEPCPSTRPPERLAACRSPEQGMQGRGFGRRRQTAPSKTKQIQVKLLGFAWFYSSESGLFNGLQRFQIEKAGPVSRCVLAVSSAFFPFFSSPPGIPRSPARSGQCEKV